MRRLRERLLSLMQDPRFAALIGDPRAQRLAVRVIRARGRLEGAWDRRIQRLAGRLRLATQKDLRALNRRIRDLERELQEAEARLTEREDAREARVRS